MQIVADSGRARRRPGTAWCQDTLPAMTRPGPVGPQVGADLTGAATGRRRIIAGAAAPLPFGGLGVLPRWRR